MKRIIPPERKLSELERADENARTGRALSGQQRPRTLHAIIEQAARLVNCGQCWARPGTPCVGDLTGMSGQCRRRNPHTPHDSCQGLAPEFPSEPIETAETAGWHVARFCRASRKGLLTGQDMATVFESAGDVFTNATIIRDGAR